ncbi:MAG: hypothetical protein U0T07_08205 [Chitinophagales bacterium]
MTSQLILDSTRHTTVQDTTKPVITGTPADITYACASDVPQRVHRITPV